MPVPFYDEEFEFAQPDGSRIKVKGWGNQNYAVFETLDGYTIIEDPITGFYQYAKLSADKSYLEPTGVKVGLMDPGTLGLEKHLRGPKRLIREMSRISSQPMGFRSRWEERRQRAKSALRMTMAAPGIFRAPPSEERIGEYVGLCILIQFPDVEGEIPQSNVNDFCNKQGYNDYENKGSVYDYFYEVSGGKLKYTNIVTSYYTAKNAKAYYTNENIPQPVRAVELIEESLSDLKAKGFDFGQLSSDDEGYIYALNIFYAGPRINNWGKGIWPHSWHLDYPYELGNGKRFFDYQITDMGYELAIATFCHENGHLVCDFPDLYDYGYDDPLQVPESNGVGLFCLMGSGGRDKKNPTQICAYLKFKAGWADKVTPIKDGDYIVKSGVNDFLILAKNATEYFIIENRVNEGRDSSLPASGLAIWHVDELGSNDFEDMTPKKHYECSIEQADNFFELESRTNIGDAGDLFSSSTNPKFGDSTGPGSKWWDGTSSGLEIADISDPGREMSFKSIKKGKNFIKTSKPDKSIPDNDKNGIIDIITFDEDALVSSLKVSVSISHTWRGDLMLILESPSGVRSVLHDRKGGGEDDLETSFDITSTPDLRNLLNQPLKGKWALLVQDLAPSDTGTLNSWGLEIEGGEETTNNVVEVEEISGMNIPDNDPTGITGTIMISAPGTVNNVEVSIDITHSYIEDLVVTLISPQGTRIDLHHKIGGSQDNIIKSYNASTTPDLGKLAGEIIKGKWRLNLVDLAADDVGKLNRWSLRIIPE